MLFAVPCFAQERPKPIKKEKVWIALAGLSAASVLSDAAATMRDRDIADGYARTYGPNGCGIARNQPCAMTEINPLERPFVNLPKPAYYSWRIGEAAFASYLGLRMKRSHRWIRHIWWVPQAVTIVSGAVGAAYSASHR